jgi:chromosomal replication initiation ATPase DnaA
MRHIAEIVENIDDFKIEVPQLSEEELLLQKENNDKLVANSEQKIKQIRANNLDLLRNYFSDYMPDYSDKKMSELFKNNANRKHKLRTFMLEERLYYWHIFDDGNIFLDTNKEKISVFSPLINCKNDLEKLGFSLHSLDLICDWGNGKLEYIKHDIFNRYIINDGKESLSYYFFGTIGAGKTTLLTGIARMLYVILNTKPRYISMTQLVNLFTASKSYDNKYIQNEAQEKLERLELCDFLFIDNLSFATYTEKQSEYAIDFIYERYRKRKPIFFASNNDIRKKELQTTALNLQLKSWLSDRSYFYEPICLNWKDRRH